MEEEAKTEATEEITEPAKDGDETPEQKAAEAPPKKAPPFDKPLNKMTNPELKDIAMEIPGVTGAHAMKKDELLAIIREYWKIEDEGLQEKKKKAPKPIATIKSLKAKMVELREEKARARQAHEKERMDILRRRINRLKKQTRKVAKG
ncbi:MAG: transcription termination factor Rho [Thermodesulfobacteriota bacterium]